MFQKIINTNCCFALTVARLSLGGVMFAHGAQKVLGCFGGHGFSATMAMFTGPMGIPWVFALLAIIAEFAGSLGLIVGFLSRIAAFGIAATMLVAIFMVHGHMGFFMNWSGTQSGEGFEYHILALGLAFAVMLGGGGALSVDKMLAKKCCH